MRVSIVGSNLPGRSLCRPDGSSLSNVHVGVQLNRDPAGLTSAGRPEARWEIDVDVVESDGQVDFRGPAVHGKRGDRFIYLTWGEVGADQEFEMFRRAKLMLNRIDPGVLEAARNAHQIIARVDLTGDDGSPRCARVDHPAIVWSAPNS